MRAEGVPDAPGTMKSTPGGVVDFSVEEERTMCEGPDPEPARGIDDDVARLVESLREAQRRAAGISRRALRDFVRTRLREGRGVAEAMLVTGTLRGADIVELVPELVPLVSSEEYGERAGELLARIPFDEAVELVVPEVLGMILRVDYWDLWNLARLLHRLGHHDALRHVVEVIDSCCDPDTRMVGEWITDELLSAAAVTDVTELVRRASAGRRSWSPAIASGIAQTASTTRNFTISWEPDVGESWMRLQRGEDLLGCFGVDIPLLFCTNELAEGDWPDPVVVASVPSLTRPVVACDREVLEHSFGTIFDPWDFYPLGFSVIDLCNRMA